MSDAHVPKANMQPSIEGDGADVESNKIVAGRSDNRSPMFREVQASPEPVDGAKLLEDIVATIKRYVVAEDETLCAAALWALHTWAMDVWTVSPIANITAPEMRCGKTLLLQVLEELVYRPMQTSNSSSAALYRVVEEWRPTLLIDEVDSFLKGNDYARGIINAGLYRKGAYVSRCVGERFTPTQFSVWAAKALCGIGRLASTLADRSISLRLRRKLADENTENLRHSDPAEWSALRSRILRWVEDHREELAVSRPRLISGLNDRANDCWEPLLAVAEVSGGAWVERARSAAVALQDVEDDSESVGVELLRDVRNVFIRNGVEKMFSSDLLRALTGYGSETRWVTYNAGRSLTAHQLAKQIRQFGVQARALRIGGKAGANGYELSWFADAFKRYLPLESPTPQHHLVGAVSQTPADQSVVSDNRSQPQAAIEDTDARLGVGQVSRREYSEEDLAKYAKMLD